MSAHEFSLPVRVKFFTTGTKILFGIMAAGLAAYAYRLLFGLGSATNLTDQYPWGLWIAVDVASGVALAAGGFTTAALV
ncbi:MAG: Ni/Fe-hydrogenase cytochrome b subunit, partial [candidate division Zixibacteria bacterium]|nr:Ni/Fe-hydrogenase cytochrome b subunit [candidate division Zixibacteria bacterium]